MTNKEIAKLFRAVAASYSIKNEKKFRFQIIAYQKAADAVDGLTTQLEDLYKEGELEEIPGIGATIKGRLEELFKKGKVKHFEDVMKGIPPSVFVLMEIPSIGPKKAFRISSHFHIKNPQTCINEVEKLAKSGKIAKLEGFGEKSEADILRAISEFKEGKGKTTRILLSYAGEVADQILDYLKKFEYVKDAAPLGSLRRMKPLVGDIDIAATTTKPKQLIEHFIKYKRVDRIIEKGPTTASILTTAGNQIDLMVLSPKKWGSLLQHFTGSKDHNVALREYALKKSLSLSEKGIKNLKTGKMNEFSKEEEFYKSLGLSWIPPEMRENTGEIELALKNKLPKIVELGNIKGDFHIHTSFPVEPSHDLGKNSISEMLQKAKELGYEYLGFSEHNPSQSKHTKQEIIDLILKRNEEVERQNNLHGVKTFKLMETDILPNGELALPEEALEKLDATIVSIHSVFKMGRTEMTKRVLTGLSHPKAKILAHPTGRLLNERESYDADWEAIFKLAAEKKKLLEINGFYNRLDLRDDLVRQAKNFGVKFIINTDSHQIDQMDNMRYGVSVARRGWAEAEEIINTWDWKDLAKWFNI